MKKDVLIRKALPTDADAVLALIQELATFERAPDAVALQAQDLIDDGFTETDQAVVVAPPDLRVTRNEFAVLVAENNEAPVSLQEHFEQRFQ